MYEELTGVVMQGVEDAKQVIEQEDGSEIEEEIEIFKCVMKGRKGGAFAWCCLRVSRNALLDSPMPKLTFDTFFRLPSQC